MNFPDCMMVSNNYFHPKWCAVAHRRLKNVAVTLEWIPDSMSLKMINEIDKELTANELQSIKRTFEMFSASARSRLGSGALQRSPSSTAAQLMTSDGKRVLAQGKLTVSASLVMFEPDEATNRQQLCVDTRDVISADFVSMGTDETEHSTLTIQLKQGFISRLEKDTKAGEVRGDESDEEEGQSTRAPSGNPDEKVILETPAVVDASELSTDDSPNLASPAKAASETGRVMFCGMANSMFNLCEHLQSLIGWYHKERLKASDTKLTIVELREMLKALGMSVQNERDMRQRLEELQIPIGADGGGLDIQKITKLMISTDRFNRVQNGRYFVATSLREAEALRGCIHLRQGRPLVDGKNAQIALRVGDTMIDSTGGFQEAGPYQAKQARQLFKYFNSDLEYTDSEVSLLLSGIKHNALDERQTYFEEIRSCRRRSRKDWRISALSPVFTTPDEFLLLARRAVLATVRLLIRVNGMRLLDAFRAFDYNHDGLLMCSELYGGLEWLGMMLLPSDIHELVRHVDKSREGRVRWDDFQKALEDEELDEQGEDAWQLEQKTKLHFMRVRIRPKAMEELWIDPRLKDIKVVDDIPMSVLQEIKIKPKQASNFVEVWNSKYSNSRKKVSVWEPVLEKTFKIRRNKMRLCLGHYASTSYSKPSKSKSLLIELTDTATSRVFKSSNLDDAHLNHLVPHPIRYKQIWSQVDKNSAFYAWKPIPPNKNYVCLGMIGTNSPQEPPLQIWDDTGTGGKRGSLWTVNSFGTIIFSNSHTPPPGPHYELKARRFMAHEGYVKGAFSLKPDLNAQF
ncbi:hypothetical protein AAMO2058_001653500 [Amorphochlora amoebiformis]